MVSCDTCSLTLALVSVFLLATTDARSWDVAVAIGDEIHFFAQNVSYEVQVDGAKTLMGLAYDGETRTMYMSDSTSDDVSMYSINLTDKEHPYTLLKKKGNTLIRSIVFDQHSRTLFWADQYNETIWKMQVPLDGDRSTPEQLHKLKQAPYGIALDMCNRHIFWSSCFTVTNCSIERSNLDGTDRKVLFNSSLYNVMGLAIDHADEKLYWMDDLEGETYSIEWSNLDGTERKVFLNGSNGQPLHIAVGKEAVYWTDKQSKIVWKVKKDPEIENRRVEPLKIYSKSHPDALISGIMTRDNIEDINCNAILEGKKKQPKINTSASKPLVTSSSTSELPTPSTATPETLVEPSSDLTDSLKEMNSPIQLEKNCLNGGHYDEFTATCVCQKGFTGSLCETSKCHNYCIHGECSLDAEGLPECVCGNIYSGTRCERDVCDNYCLNNGICSVTSTGPVCKCTNSQGPRCEYRTEELDILCSRHSVGTEDMVNVVNKALCKCSEVNGTLPEPCIVSDSLVSSTIIISTLSTIIVVLVIVVGVLSYHVNKLRRRPRIRKRFVVSKGGVTPLTSRPQVPADSCEITIENCCNMNICETPCFEPKLRATPSKSSSTKVEEKNSLLDSMEGADSC